jgi:hypothetical protein
MHCVDNTFSQRPGQIWPVKSASVNAGLDQRAIPAFQGQMPTADENDVRADIDGQNR